MMVASRSSCISCGRAFAENRELAAIPDASKVAFDPVHQRVWRICASCGEWNLLGPDATAAALPEVEARFTAAIPNGVPELGFAPARVSPRLELLRVGRSDLLTARDSPSLGLRHEVDRRKMMVRRATGVIGAVFIAWIAFTISVSHNDPMVPVSMLFLYSSIAFLDLVSDRLQGKRASGREWLITGVLVLIGLSLMARFRPQDLKYYAIGILVTTPIFAIVRRLSRSRLPTLDMRLGDGTKVHLTEDAIPRVTLSWTPGQTDLSLHDLPRERALYGSNATVVLRKLAPRGAKIGIPRLLMSINAITEKAYELLRTVGGLPGLLCALDGFRRDNDGRVLIVDLPVVYLVALDLALATQHASFGPGGILRDKALEAAVIAGEAEQLDKE